MNTFTYEFVYVLYCICICMYRYRCEYTKGISKFMYMYYRSMCLSKCIRMNTYICTCMHSSEYRYLYVYVYAWVGALLVKALTS